MPGRDAPLQNLANPLDEGVMQFAQMLASREVYGAMEVLAVHEVDELGMFQVVVPREVDESRHRLPRRQGLELEGGFRAADPLVGRLENRDEERLLVPEVVVEQRLVDTGPVRDLVDPRAAESLLGEHGGRRGEDRSPTRLGIARTRRARAGTRSGATSLSLRVSRGSGLSLGHGLSDPDWKAGARLGPSLRLRIFN